MRKASEYVMARAVARLPFLLSLLPLLLVISSLGKSEGWISTAASNNVFSMASMEILAQAADAGASVTAGAASAGQEEAAHQRRQLLDSVCSTTDDSAAAVLSCTNAVRANPDIMADFVRLGCIDATTLAGLRNPPRLPLTSSKALDSASMIHNNKMVAAKKLSYQLPGEDDMGKLARASGYNWYRLSMNIAMGPRSAREVVALLLCNQANRDLMFSCVYSDIGVAAGGGFFTQMYGCTNQFTCNSCGTPFSTTSPSPSPRRPPPPRSSPPPSPSPRRPPPPPLRSPSPPPRPSPSQLPLPKQSPSPRPSPRKPPVPRPPPNRPPSRGPPPK
ncbi:hypothetical protein Vretimale_13108 [Volvox reticuliferus]|uniref:SCP domain-containing protein n=1 Tax=Volvox reticuliferus TaxID=1737510 RepID=A0A8J4CQA4_9CHLO|nr:hypothetical protein Vretifemale_15842 [Volvox reticuliferus]GIM09233.1 hypothetical protein Vretimale_13108 [Volvox reticuliferus]